MSETTTPKLWAVLTDRGSGPEVTVEHTFGTTAHDLWQAVTDPERIGRWMAPTVLAGPAAVAPGTSSTSAVTARAAVR